MFNRNTPIGSSWPSFRFIRFFIIFLLFIPSVFAETSSVFVVTENAPPFSYLENGKISGIGAEIVETVLKRAGISYEHHLFPWARAYRHALNHENTLIYSIARMPERETLFKWVGEIYVVKYYFWKLKKRTDITVNSIEDARRYRIGVVQDDIRAQFLKQNGFKKIESVRDNHLNLKKLYWGRIDLVPISKIGIRPILKEIGLNQDEFEAVRHIEDLNTGLYMAYNAKTGDRLVDRTRRSLCQIKDEGVMNAIFKKYLDNW